MTKDGLMQTKERRLGWWLSRFSWLDKLVDKSELDCTGDVDALCRSLVKDYCLQKWWKCHQRDAVMLSAKDNMSKHADLCLADKNGCMHLVDTKYPSHMFKKGMWYEVEKNAKSKASKIMYVLDDETCIVLDREAANEALKHKKREIGRASGEVICWFELSDIPAEHIKTCKLAGVFKDIEDLANS